MNTNNSEQSHPHRQRNHQSPPRPPPPILPRTPITAHYPPRQRVSSIQSPPTSLAFVPSAPPVTEPTNRHSTSTTGQSQSYPYRVQYHVGLRESDVPRSLRIGQSQLLPQRLDIMEGPGEARSNRPSQPQPQAPAQRPRSSAPGQHPRPSNIPVRGPRPQHSWAERDAANDQVSPINQVGRAPENTTGGVQARSETLRPSSKQQQQSEAGSVPRTAEFGKSNVHMVLPQEPDLLDLVANGIIEWVDLSKPPSTEHIPNPVQSPWPSPSMSSHERHTDGRMTNNLHRKLVQICHAPGYLERHSGHKLPIVSPPSAAWSGDSGYSSASPVSEASEEVWCNVELDSPIEDLCISLGRPDSWSSSLDGNP